MYITYLICCSGLLLISFLLVYFIRSSRTFAIYPGTVSVLLFLTLGGYLMYMIFTTNPGAPPRIKDYKTSLFLKKYAKDQNTYIYRTREIQDNMDNYLSNIAFLVDLLVFQSVVCIVAAIVGMKMVPARKSYYRWALTLHVFLIPALFAAEYLMYHRHA
ncbi:MAG TPA: hypothetical protein VGO45_00200 [Bacteroidia bacterium]|jgi:ABC-type antimicrobial peptide transport system permease subunit|nr:hypothetical protein [Bacteroidia bacterium]